MDGNADDGSVAVEDAFDVFFRQDERVEVSDEDARVDCRRIARVRNVANLAHGTSQKICS